MVRPVAASMMYTQRTEKIMIPFLDSLMGFGRNGKGYCGLIWNPIRLIVHKFVDGGESMRIIGIVDGRFTKRAYERIDIVVGIFFGHGGDIHKNHVILSDIQL